jgi:UDP-glucuronate decarboxylase
MNSQTSRKKTIVVTGGAGFIGSHLCEKYLNEGHRVIAIDNLQTTFTPKHIKHLLKHPEFKFIKNDIIDPFDPGEHIDWIFNFACSGSPTSYQFDPVHTTKTNTIGMINMLELARKNNARILQASTSEVYGDPLEAPQKETYTGNVTTIGPRACYDEGKRVAETLCMDYRREYGTDTKIIRIFNTYGPKMDPHDGRAVTNFVMNALAGDDLVIYGDGSQTRSFQYIDDLIEGIDLMMKKDGFPGPVNLGNPHEITIKEVAELVLKKTKSRSKLVFAKEVTNDPKRRCPDISLAKKELYWEPKISLEQGLEKTIEYFKNIKRPDQKVLVFSTTYYPDLGPAEQALHELSKEMPNAEFHIITARFRPGLPSVERNGTDTIYRIGIGTPLDKYLLPIFGVIKARKLHREHQYRFIWSIMASYGGLAGIIFSKINPGTLFLISLDDRELVRKKGFAESIINLIRKKILREASSVYVSNLNEDEKAALARITPQVEQKGIDSREFLNQVRHTYAKLLNKQERKLHRPK